MNDLDYETKYMLYEPGERVKDLQRMEAIIDAADRNEDFLLAAEVDGKLVGYISAQTSSLRRVAHSAYIVAGIRKQFCGQGIGTEFLDEYYMAKIF